MTDDDPAAAVYRTKPAALVVKPHAVYYLNWLLKMYEAEVIDEHTLWRIVTDEIQALLISSKALDTW